MNLEDLNRLSTCFRKVKLYLNSIFFINSDRKDEI